ncbi:uncharacterized protein JCM6883_007385 [Sporobolomyces salmoneus]|uniref:uncharacterized protein n=1 Tax=Sporobolomyces salmoneus TaxID=183962 RepID=UPI00317BA079
MVSLTQLDEDSTRSPTAKTTDTTTTSTSNELSHNEQTLGGRARDDALTEELESNSILTWSREELQEIISTVKALKVKGTGYFGREQYELALETYRQALGDLPPRRPVDSDSDSVRDKGKGKEKASEESEQLIADAEGTEATGETAIGKSNDGGKDLCEEEEKEISQLRTVLFSNVAACLLKLNRWKDAVKASDEALLDDPNHVKARYRRAQANESIGSWGSLSASLEDFNHLATLPDLSPYLTQQIRLARSRIPKAIEIQQQKEKDEVMGKLKNLGNTVLGKFGFSLDNFKMQEQPGGGYSMSFQQ